MTGQVPTSTSSGQLVLGPWRPKVKTSSRRTNARAEAVYAGQPTHPARGEMVRRLGSITLEPSRVPGDEHLGHGRTLRGPDRAGQSMKSMAIYPEVCFTRPGDERRREFTRREVRLPYASQAQKRDYPVRGQWVVVPGLLKRQGTSPGLSQGEREEERRPPRPSGGGLGWGRRAKGRPGPSVGRLRRPTPATQALGPFLLLAPDRPPLTSIVATSRDSAKRAFLPSTGLTRREA